MSEETQSTTWLVGQIQRLRPALRRSELRVADVVLASPHEVVDMSVAALARAANVSDPTVVRFCRSVGCKGFQDFKIRLARSLAVGSFSYAQFEIQADDSLADIASKVCDRAVAAITAIREQVDAIAMERAIDAIVRARKLELFGCGASGSVVIDAQHKFFRLDIPTIAHRDVHMQTMSAAIFRPSDVLICISKTGRTRDVVECAQRVAEKGATVIALAPTGSPLAAAATITLRVDIEEDTEVFTPMASRIAHLMVIDMLATGVAVRQGAPIGENLRRVKESLLNKRIQSDSPIAAQPVPTPAAPQQAPATVQPRTVGQGSHYSRPPMGQAPQSTPQPATPHYPSTASTPAPSPSSAVPPFPTHGNPSQMHYQATPPPPAPGDASSVGAGSVKQTSNVPPEQQITPRSSETPTEPHPEIASEFPFHPHRPKNYHLL